MGITIGELVTRSSYQHDLLFRVAELNKDIAILHGAEMRLEVDAPLHDLVVAKRQDVERRKQKEKEKEEFSYRLFRQDYQLMKEKGCINQQMVI